MTATQADLTATVRLTVVDAGSSIAVTSCSEPATGVGCSAVRTVAGFRLAVGVGGHITAVPARAPIGFPEEPARMHPGVLVGGAGVRNLIASAIDSRTGRSVAVRTSPYGSHDLFIALPRNADPLVVMLTPAHVGRRRKHPTRREKRAATGGDHGRRKGTHPKRRGTHATRNGGQVKRRKQRRKCTTASMTPRPVTTPPTQVATPPNRVAAPVNPVTMPVNPATTTTLFGTTTSAGTTPATTASTPAGDSSIVPFLASGPWADATARQRPLDPQSSAIVANLSAQIQTYYGHAALNTYSYSAPDLHRSRRSADGQHGLEQLPGEDWPRLRRGSGDVPIPADAVPSSGSDAEIVIWQPSAQHRHGVGVLGDSEGRKRQLVGVLGRSHHRCLAEPRFLPRRHRSDRLWPAVDRVPHPRR